MRNIKKTVLQQVNPIIDNGKVVIGFHPCGECFACSAFTGTSSQVNSINGKTTLNGNYCTCSTNNIVYYIHCTKCGKAYIGETRFNLQKRISQHLASIRLGYDTAVAKHFDTTHNVATDFICGVLKHSISWNELQRKEKEGDMINKLNTRAPNGMNLTQGIKTKRIVIPYLEAQLRCNRIDIPDNTKIVYSNAKNLKRIMINSTKNKIIDK